MVGPQGPAVLFTHGDSWPRGIAHFIQGPAALERLCVALRGPVSHVALQPWQGSRTNVHTQCMHNRKSGGPPLVAERSFKGSADEAASTGAQRGIEEGKGMKLRLHADSKGHKLSVLRSNLSGFDQVKCEDIKRGVGCLVRGAR